MIDGALPQTNEKNDGDDGKSYVGGSGEGVCDQYYTTALRPRSSTTY